MGQLNLAYPNGSVLEFNSPSPWPLNEDMRDGWFEGVPYFLQDMRPDGFLGLQFARLHAQLLQLADDPRSWSDDDFLYAISILGSDQSGNLIVGEGAYRLWLQQIQRAPECLNDAEVPQAYSERAERSLQYVTGGSSAAGEFPKFTALRTLSGSPAHVLVKFSGSDTSPGTQRWSDLLVCEHIASGLVGDLPGLISTPTSIVQAGKRTFLEVVRFDRHAAHGRSPLCSWASINYAWFGIGGRSWIEGARRLHERRLIDQNTALEITRLWLFGQLIGNTDMHDGNLSFRPDNTSESRPSLQLAPVYDMLPMMYAPRRGVEVGTISFTPQLPLPGERESWHQAATVAIEFWSHAADDTRISPQFRRVCAENAGAVRKAMQLSV